jgi:hypothetical protein
MTKPNDGGPLFPQERREWIEDRGRIVDVTYSGATLLDYFAGQAMQALVSKEGYDRMTDVACDAYSYAQAMIEELERRMKG